MADTDAKPMDDADILPAAPDTGLQAEAPLKDTAVDVLNEEGPKTTGTKPDARQAIKDGADKIGQQALDKVRTFADDGKAKAGGALDQLAQMLNDAAGTVDEKVGEQYGQYARTAANTVTGFAEQIRAKDVEDLLEDARGFVKQSPGLAVGAAAALGFVVARLVQSGIDGNKA